MEKPSSKRVLMRESGTFLFSSLRTSESGLLIPELPAATSSSSASLASLEKGDEDLELELNQKQYLFGLCASKSTSSGFEEEEEETKGRSAFPRDFIEENAIFFSQDREFKIPLFTALLSLQAAAVPNVTSIDEEKECD